MAIVKCEKGHYYDNVKYDTCPHCKGHVHDADDDNEKTIAKISNDRMKKNLASFVAGNDERTISIFSSKNRFSPVVGWLVCIEGLDKGRDFRIISGRNFIGRAHQMDITLADDPEISRENHCSVVYDPTTRKFSLLPGNSSCYYNGEKILNPLELKIYDQIQIGQSKLVFIPFCKEGLSW